MYQLHVVLGEKDYARLGEQQRRSGLSTSALVRSLLTGLEAKEHPTEMVMQICRELDAIGNNLNQLAWAANQDTLVGVEQLAATKQTLGQLWHWTRFDSELAEVPRKWPLVHVDAQAEFYNR